MIFQVSQSLFDISSIDEEKFPSNSKSKMPKAQESEKKDIPRRKEKTENME